MADDLLDHGTSLLPDCEPSAMLTELIPALERERHFDVRWWRLMRGKLFKEKAGKPVTAPALPPHDSWIGPLPWPAGTNPASGSHAVLAGFIRFIWQKKRKDAKRCVCMSVMLGMCPAIISLLLGRAVDECNPDTSIGDTNADQKLVIVGWVLGIMGVFLVKLRLDYRFEVDVPDAHSTRLDTCVMRVLLGRADEAQPPPAIAQNPGGASTLLTHTVQVAVDNVWSNLFTAVQGGTGLVCGLLVTIGAATISGANAGWIVGLVVLACLPLITVLLTFHLRQKPSLKLARLEEQWYLRYGALVASLLGPSPYRGAADQPLSPDDAVQAFADAAFVYHKRARHSYFSRLVMQDLMNTLVGLFFIGTLLLTANMAIDGEVTIGTFVTIVSAAQSIVSFADALSSLMTDLPQGYVAVQQLAAVFNGVDHTVSEGGGTNKRAAAASYPEADVARA